MIGGQASRPDPQDIIHYPQISAILPPMKRLGILGGGQLAQMLALASLRMGIKTRVYAEPGSESAASVCPDTVYGEYADVKSLGIFLDSVDVAIFESEFIPTKYLRDFKNVEFLPSLNCIEILQNKLSQKKLISGLSSPKFLECTESKEIFLQKCSEEFNGKCVLKWATLGYDGKGVKICRTKDEIMNSSDFCDQVLKRNGGLFAEELIEFERELACIGVRDKNGVTKTYPVVVSEQDNGICSKVFGPADEIGVANTTTSRVSEIVKEIGERAEIIGAFGVEFFEKNGEVFINEIAPRVHNTGHYTQDAAFTSQFENHVRAVLGLPLGLTLVHSSFIMLNILGEKGEFNYPKLSSNFHLHWYNKSEHKLRRKLGHINGTGKIEDLKREISAFKLFK